MRALFDTNVIIAAFATEGLCSKIFSRAGRGEFVLCSCPFIIKELREKLRSKLSLTHAEIKEVLSLLKEASLIEDPVRSGVEVKGVCRDSDDDSVLACALATRSEHIVTGDKELLGLKSYKGIRIVSPRDFELLF